jgi:hypothetical protein
VTILELTLTVAPSGVTRAELTRYGRQGCPRTVLRLSPSTTEAATLATAARAAQEAWGAVLRNPVGNLLIPARTPDGPAHRVVVYEVPDPVTGDTQTRAPVVALAVVP